jgi:tetratricopeptide (TPR) repeat protein
MSCRVHPHFLRTTGLVFSLLLTACSVTFERPELPSLSPTPNPYALSAADIQLLNSYANEQRVAAREAQQAERFRDAQSHWLAVLTLHPNDAEAEQGLQGARSAAQAAAAAHFLKVQAARARKDLEAAQRWALETLALDPTHTEAVSALRQLQLERNRRLGRSNGAMSATDSTRRARARSGTSTGTSTAVDDLEHASLLADAGEIEGALQILLPLTAKPGANPELRNRTCTLLLRQARARLTSDRKAALSSIERCLQVQPKHSEAVRLQQSLRAQPR